MGIEPTTLVFLVPGSTNWASLSPSGFVLCISFFLHPNAVLTLTTHNPEGTCLVDTLWGATSGKEKWFQSALLAVLHLCLSLRVLHHPTCGPPNTPQGKRQLQNKLASKSSCCTFLLLLSFGLSGLLKCLANATSNFCFCNCVVWKSIGGWDKPRCSGNGIPPGSEDLRPLLFLSFD